MTKEIEYNEFERSMRIALLDAKYSELMVLNNLLMQKTIVEKKPAVEVIEIIRDAIYEKMDECKNYLSKIIGEPDVKKTDKKTDGKNRKPG